MRNENFIVLKHLNIVAKSKKLMNVVTTTKNKSQIDYRYRYLDLANLQPQTKTIMSNIPGKVSSQEIKRVMPPPPSSNNALASRKATMIPPSTAPRTSIQSSKKVAAVTPEYEISANSNKKKNSIRQNAVKTKRIRAKGNSFSNAEGKSSHLVGC